MNNAKRAALASAFIFPGAGLFILGQRVRGCIFAVPAALIIFLLMMNLVRVALQLNAELQTQAEQGHFAIDIVHMWNALHGAVFASPYWADGKWLLLAAWVLSIISAYSVGKKMDLAHANTAPHTSTDSTAN